MKGHHASKKGMAVGVPIELDTGMQNVWNQRENFRRLFTGQKFTATNTRLCNFDH